MPSKTNKKATSTSTSTSTAKAKTMKATATIVNPVVKKATATITDTKFKALVIDSTLEAIFGIDKLLVDKLIAEYKTGTKAQLKVQNNLVVGNFNEYQAVKSMLLAGNVFEYEIVYVNTNRQSHIDALMTRYALQAKMPSLEVWLKNNSKMLASSGGTTAYRKKHGFITTIQLAKAYNCTQDSIKGKLKRIRAKAKEISAVAKLDEKELEKKQKQDKKQALKNKIDSLVKQIEKLNPELSSEQKQALVNACK